jgi:aminoglycoside phosphotransferase
VTASRRISAERLPPPTFDTVEAYGARLGDLTFWAPYVAAILRRHALPSAPIAVGAVGTFPTFLVGQHVVKLFGDRFSGAACFEVERTLHRLLRLHPAIPAPSVVADGAFFDACDEPGEIWRWPYLITTRLTGAAWADAALAPAGRAALAHQLGAVVLRLHDLPPPTGPIWERDWLAELRASCVERQRRWGTLPAQLIDRIDAYLLAPRPERRLLHADLHDHHLFVDGGRLVGIVDWGDAVVADPYYELPALHLGTFGADGRLLAAFLDGYGWRLDPDFVRRAMSMTLLHEFDVLRDLPRRGQLGAIREIATIEELADVIWRLP